MSKILIAIVFIIWMLLTFVLILSILGLIVIIPWMEMGMEMLYYLIDKEYDEDSL